MNFGCHYDEWKNPCAKNPSFIILYMWLYWVHCISRNENWKNIAHFSGCIPAPHENNIKLTKLLQYRCGKGARDICIRAHTCNCPGDRAWDLTAGLNLTTVEPLCLSVHRSLLSCGFPILCYLQSSYYYLLVSPSPSFSFFQKPLWNVTSMKRALFYIHSSEDLPLSRPLLNIW